MAAKMFNAISIVLILVTMLNGGSASALGHLDVGFQQHHGHEAIACTPSANPQKWASNRTFHVGDTISFKYPRGQDSVVLVDRLAYHAFDSSSPLASFRTGNDAITFKRRGHYFFISGVEQHCNHGQKFNVRIPRGPHGAAAAQQQEMSSLFLSAIVLAAIGAILLVLWFLFRLRNLTRLQSCSNSFV